MTDIPPPADDTDLDERARRLRDALETARADVQRAERRADRARRRGEDPEPARADQQIAEARIRQLATELGQIPYERQARADARDTTS